MLQSILPKCGLRKSLREHFPEDFSQDTRALLNPITFTKKKKSRTERCGIFYAENSNGKVRFVDPQNGKMNCEEYFTDALKNGTIIARLDHLKVTDLIEQCIKNRGGKQ